MERIIQTNAQVILRKTIPVWMVTVLLINSTVGVGLIEYFIMQKNYNTAFDALAQTANNPDRLIQILKREVLPQNGYALGVVWKDIGRQLVDSGVIDKQKYDQLLSKGQDSKGVMKYLTDFSNDHMVINQENSHFMVNTLWALGLVNKSKILDGGQMKIEGQGNPMNFASTGGWNLGSKLTSNLYSSQSLIQLTLQQEQLVSKIASNIYRPCCGNSVAFPDCNHGMAALGYIEIAVSQKLSEGRIYQDVLALNSFWFPKQSINLAAYFNQQKTDWKHVDAKLALGSEYSSKQGAARVAQAVQNIPGLSTAGGGCSA